MPSLNSKALLFEINTFIADNNIRRSVLTLATNTQSTDGVLNDRSLLVKTGLVTPIVIDCVDNNKATIIKCTGGPLTFTVKIGDNEPDTFPVASVWVMTTNIKELSVTNPGTRDIQMRIIQT
jgi:hypothetical protein